MDSMRSLNTSLPTARRRQLSQPPEHLMQSFKQAALSVTNLYKAAAVEHDKAFREGYQEALEDLLGFLDKENLGLQDGEGWRVRKWATERFDGSSLAAGASISESEEEVEEEKEATSSSPSLRRKKASDTTIQRPQSTAPKSSPVQTRSESAPPITGAAVELGTLRDDRIEAYTAPSSDFTFQPSNQMEMDTTDSNGLVQINVFPRPSRSTRQSSRNSNTNRSAASLGLGAGNKRRFGDCDFFSLGGFSSKDGSDQGVPADEYEQAKCWYQVTLRLGSRFWVMIAVRAPLVACYAFASRIDLSARSSRPTRKIHPSTRTSQRNLIVTTLGLQAPILLSSISPPVLHCPRSSNMLEARLEQADTLKKTVDAIKDLVQDCNFDCNDSGISLQAMDNSHVALVSMMLRAETFAPFRCDRNVALGINLNSLTKVLRAAQSSDILTLKAEDSPDVVNLVYESPKEDRISEYDIKLMDIDQEHLGIPETEYSATVKMPSAEFQRITRDLGAISESVAIECTKEGVKFSSQGDIGNGSVTLRQTTSVEDPDGNVEIHLTEPVALTFSLKYLSNFCKATSLSKQVTLSLSNEVPLLVEYGLANNSHLRFYLAPKIGDEE